MTSSRRFAMRLASLKHSAPLFLEDGKMKYTEDQPERDIVVVGGGIIGCTSAYFLTRHPAYDPVKHRITIVEATNIASGASGKAGGLLGLWAFPRCLVPLSFKLHSELAAEHSGRERWGYRRISCGTVEAKGIQVTKSNDANDAHAEKIGALHKRPKNDASHRTSDLPDDLDWIDQETSPTYAGLGNTDNTAQVHPYQFTTAMAQLAEEKGVKIEYGLVSNIERSQEGVNSVTYNDNATSSSKTIPATDIIIAAGPWSGSVYPPAPIETQRAHSVTIRPSKPVSGYAVFSEIRLPPDFGKDRKPKRSHKKVVTPEIYARPNNEAYACGDPDQLVPLPKTTAEVETDDARCQDIVDYVSSISEELRDGEVTARQACYLPLTVTRDGPLIGHTGVKGLLLAAGHTCWGIQNGPGTGKLISEFIFDGEARSANISGLDPRKFM